MAAAQNAREKIALELGLGTPEQFKLLGDAVFKILEDPALRPFYVWLIAFSQCLQ